MPYGVATSDEDSSGVIMFRLGDLQLGEVRSIRRYRWCMQPEGKSRGVTYGT